MSKTIIVGVDGSETAQRAARRAASLAVKLDAELVVVTAPASDNTAVVSIGDFLLVSGRIHSIRLSAHPSTQVYRCYIVWAHFPWVALPPALTSLTSLGESGNAQLVRA